VRKQGIDAKGGRRSIQDYIRKIFPAAFIANINFVIVTKPDAG
jgi:hypothetical protein